MSFRLLRSKVVLSLRANDKSISYKRIKDLYTKLKKISSKVQSRQL